MSYDASGWTDTKGERKTNFGIFENECHAVRATGQTRLSEREYFFIFQIFYFFVIFNIFQIFLFFFLEKEIKKVKFILKKGIKKEKQNMRYMGN